MSGRWRPKDRVVDPDLFRQVLKAKPDLIRQRNYPGMLLAYSEAVQQANQDIPEGGKTLKEPTIIAVKQVAAPRVVKWTEQLREGEELSW
jgi:hypothetical protein